METCSLSVPRPWQQTKQNEWIAKGTNRNHSQSAAQSLLHTLVQQRLKGKGASVAKPA